MSSLLSESTTRTPQDITSLSGTASNIEGRLLHLVKEAASGAVPLEDVTGELSLLSKDLRRCYRQVKDTQERRDFGFEAITKLQEIERHCMWLYRKAHLEQAFYKKLLLEPQLQSLISVEAFGMYQELLNAEEQEREFMAIDDAEICRRLAEDANLEPR